MTRAWPGQPGWTSFKAAIAATDKKQRHLLLGNGFSMSRHRSFAYARLYDEAIRGDPTLAPLFEGHGGDFEAALGAAERIEDQTRIRKGLVAAIGAVHPKRKFLTPEDCESCGRFLEMFAGPSRGTWRGRVFTTNYDLFLYWVLVQHQKRLKLYDGFDNRGEWEEGRLHNSFVFYLHGALHHYEGPIGRLKLEMLQYKLMYEDGNPLPDQVRRHIARGSFPVFVSEGSAPAKRAAIRANPYLRRVNARFAKHLNHVDAAVFTVGHGLNLVDEHITDTIGAGAGPVFIGVYGDSDVARAEELATEWAAKRSVERKPPIHVSWFDVRECPIWSGGASTTADPK